MREPHALRYKYSTHNFHIETFKGEHLMIENKPENADKVSALISSGQVKAMHTDNPTLGQVFLNVTGKELA